MNVRSKDFVAFGGLGTSEMNDISLREIQIKDGYLLHTCNDYGQSLENICQAANNIRRRPRIMLKVYYSYPDEKSRRFRPIIDQIEEALTRLNQRYEELILQFCCYFPKKIIISQETINFLHHIKSQYGISKIFFEYYGVYNYKWTDFLKLKQALSFELEIGFAGYQNLYNRAFNETTIDVLRQLDFSLCQIGFLGMGKKDKETIFSSKKAHTADDEIIRKKYILENILYLVNNVFEKSSSIGITSVSTEAKYIQLNEYINDSMEQYKDNKKWHIDVNVNPNTVYYFLNDHYGGVTAISDLIKNPKLILKKLTHTCGKKSMNPFLIKDM